MMKLKFKMHVLTFDDGLYVRDVINLILRMSIILFYLSCLRCNKKQVAQRATIAHLGVIINIWGLFRCSRAAKFTVTGPIWLKIEPIQNIIYVLITCKFKKYRINSNREKSGNIIILDTHSLVSRQIWPKFKLIQDLIHVLITCKYKKIGSKTTKKQWRHHFLRGYFLDFQGQITP